MRKRLILSLLLGLAVLLLAAVLLKPYIVHAQPLGDILAQDTTPYPGPEEPEPIQEPVGESYPVPETPIEEEKPAAAVPLFALIVGAVAVVVFVIIAVIVYRFRRGE